MPMLLCLAGTLLLALQVLGGTYNGRSESLYYYFNHDVPDFDPDYDSGSDEAFVVGEMCPRADEEADFGHECLDNDVCSRCAAWVVDGVLVEVADQDDDESDQLEGLDCNPSDGTLLQLSEAGVGVPGFKIKQEWQFFDSEPFFRASITITRTGRAPKSVSLQYASDVYTSVESSDCDPECDEAWFQQDGTFIDKAEADAVHPGAQCMFSGPDESDTLGVHVFGNGWTSAEVDEYTLRVFWTTPVLEWGQSATYVVYTGIGANLQAAESFCNRITAFDPVFQNCFAHTATTQNFAFPDSSSSSEKSLLLLLLLLLLLIPLLCCCCLLWLCCIRGKKKGPDTTFACFDSGATFQHVDVPATFCAAPATFCEAAPFAAPATFCNAPVVAPAATWAPGL